MTRKERVEYVVSQGYSREFAEAYIPMTEAEARAKQLEVRQYESPFSTLSRAMSKKRKA
jgi:hypothetical protein